MAKIRFKPYDQQQLTFFPVSLDEKIPPSSPVRLINHLVDGLDLSELISTYESMGTPPYTYAFEGSALRLHEQCVFLP